MRRRDKSIILLAAGVICGVVFTLLNLGGFVNERLSTLMMYAGIIAIAAGLVLFGLSGSEDQRGR
jgi:hypothetical protein